MKNISLFGSSISEGYDKQVREAFAESAQVFFSVKDVPVEFHSDMKHFYTPKVTGLIVKQVAHSISKVTGLFYTLPSFDKEAGRDTFIGQ